MDGAREIAFKDITTKFYVKESDGKVYLQVFQGRKIKHSLYRRYMTLADIENDIKYYIDKEMAAKKYKLQKKLAAKEATEKLKKELKPGVTVRTVHSYTMTFNHFYKVVSNKGNVYRLKVLQKNWVDGDIGYTGYVQPGVGTGEYVQGKLTSTGFKVGHDYANIINPDNKFYENHMD
jgi:hypothetical protein